MQRLHKLTFVAEFLMYNKDKYEARQAEVLKAWEVLCSLLEAIYNDCCDPVPQSLISSWPPAANSVLEDGTRRLEAKPIANGINRG